MAQLFYQFLILVIASTSVLSQSYQYPQNDVFNGCDYYEPIEIGRVYDVFSPYFPESYPPGTNCRWSGCAPYGTNIVIKCTDIKIPTYGSCDQYGDRLEISYQGCQELNDAMRFCTQPFITETRSNALVMALRTFPNSTGGNFFCQAYAQPTALPAPQPVSQDKFTIGQPFPQRPSYVQPTVQPYLQPYPPTIQQQNQPYSQVSFRPELQKGYQQGGYQQGGYQQGGYQQGTFQQGSVRYEQGSFQPSYYQPARFPAPARPAPIQQVQTYQQGIQTYRPVQPIQNYPPSQTYYQQGQPIYYQGGFQGRYQGQSVYPSGYQQTAYTPTQQVYQPMGPQDQIQCQYQCGYRKRPRIVNGEDIDVEQMPFACGLMDLSLRNVFCSATIISPNFIITSGHCLFNRSINTIGVMVGTTDYARPVESRYAATYKISGVVIHQDYDAISMLNDIAIAKTGPMEFNPAVAPVCLPISDRLSQQNYAYSPVEVGGWGDVANSGPPSTRIKAVTLNIITNQQCNDNYPYRITESQMCLLTPNKDTCTGDDGAGLCHVDTVTGRLVLVGMPSYGVGCNTRQPRVAVRISSYIPWILRTIGETLCII